MLEQFFAAEVVGKNPVFEGVGVKFVAEISGGEFFQAAFGQDNFGGPETLQQFVDGGVVAFGDKKFAGADIEKSRAEMVVFAVGQRCQKVVLVVFQQRIVGGDAGRNYFCYRAPHHFARVWVFPSVRKWLPESPPARVAAGTYPWRGRGSRPVRRRSRRCCGW
jgi:hypothetical protein